MITRSALVALAVALLSTTPLVGPDASARAAAVSGGDPAYQRPVVGACYQYGYRGYLKPHNSSAPTDCAQTHTALTIAVVDVPTNLAIKPSGITSTVFDRVARSCYDAEDAALGLSAEKLARTAYGVTFYAPTRRELARGSHWIRCDLVLLGGRVLADLPDQLPGAVNHTRRCAKAYGHDIHYAACDYPHNYRSTRAITIRSKRFPGLRTMQRLATAYCRASPAWFASWTPDYEWDHSSHRQLVCYVPGD